MLNCFKQANNLLSLSSSINNSEDENNILQIFRNKSFYFEVENHNLNNNCCFNHIIGLPKNNKNNNLNPLFDYQELIFDSLSNFRHLWILKATGSGNK